MWVQFKEMSTRIYVWYYSCSKCRAVETKTREIRGTGISTSGIRGTGTSLQEADGPGTSLSKVRRKTTNQSGAGSRDTSSEHQAGRKEPSHTSKFPISLSSRSGTTVPNFFGFFAVLWVHAALLIIVRLCSNLRCWIVHRLSFLEKKTELIYLHYRPFYSCSSIVFNFLAKKRPKRCAHC